jgi:hypothetical protein
MIDFGVGRGVGAREDGKVNGEHRGKEGKGGTLYGARLGKSKLEGIWR